MDIKFTLFKSVTLFIKNVSYPIQEGPTYVLFLCKSWVKILKNFVIWVYCLCSYLQAHVVKILHPDTWFTVVLITINILTVVALWKVSKKLTAHIQCHLMWYSLTFLKIHGNLTLSLLQKFFIIYLFLIFNYLYFFKMPF